MIQFTKLIINNLSTNKFGCFRIFVAEVGKCTLTIRGKKSAPSIAVDSFKTSNECSLVIYRDSKGQLRLRRK